MKEKLSDTESKTKHLFMLICWTKISLGRVSFDDFVLTRKCQNLLCVTCCRVWCTLEVVLEIATRH